MLLYYLFWMFMGFIKHFYIIFGTNLLTQSPVPVPVFSLVSVFRRKGISNGVETEWNLLEKLFLEGKQPGRLGVHVKKATRKARGRGARPPPSWAPRCSTDVLLPPIYTYVPPNQQKHPRKPNSTAATFCTREIPSWGLFRRPAGGGIDHGGLLHQHHSLCDDVWVGYLRPSGP